MWFQSEFSVNRVQYVPSDIIKRVPPIGHWSHAPQIVLKRSMSPTYQVKDWSGQFGDDCAVHMPRFFVARKCVLYKGTRRADPWVMTIATAQKGADDLEPSSE